MAKPNALGLVGKRQVILGSAILGIVLAAVIAIVCVFSVEGVSLTGEEPSSQIKGGSTIRTTTSTTSSGPTGEAANVDTTTTTSRGPVTSRTTITSPTGTTVQMPDTGDNTGVVQDANIIAYLDTYPIEREEFQFYAARNRALVAQNFKTVYNAKVTDDFWTTKYGDDTPEEMLREEALEELINTKAELILMKEYGIIKDISYSAFIKEWIDTNTARSQALRRGANLYGPVQFTKEQYFNEHPYGNLFFDGKDHGIEFYALMQVDAYNETIFNVCPDTSEAKQAYLMEIIDNALYKRELNITEDDHLVLLTTCTSDMTNGRNVLVGRLTDQVYPEKEKAKNLGTGIDQLKDMITNVPIIIWMILIIIVLLLLNRQIGKKGRKKHEKN